MALAAGHGQAPPKKEAILLVVFGTSVPEAMKAFDTIEERVKKAFPKTHVQWAYTSKIIRDKLGKQGKQLDDPVVALGKLLDDDYTHIVAASFHTLPGAEFHDLYRDVAAFRQMSGMYGRKILVSRPLLSSRERMEEVIEALQNNIPKERKPEDLVVLMGHGSEHHPGDAVYAALNYWAQQDDPNLMVGTVEGNPNLDDVMAWVKEKGGKKVYLMPFMLVAGDHARNDMCGDEEDSWKSTLEKAGHEVTCILTGTGEMPDMVDIFIKNIRDSWKHM
jgi:sirohydrochlorin cobaltochelatase